MRTTRNTAERTSLLLGSVVLAATLALGACGSDDDDDSNMGESTVGETNGADDADGEDGGDGTDGADQTSMPAPGTDGDDMDLSPVSYAFPLTVEEEIPAPTGADGASGEADLVFDPATRGMSGSIITDGLTGVPTMAHIHEQPAGEMTGPVIVAFVPDGTGTGFVLGDDVILTEEQAESLETGLLYVNVHTDLNQAGEIRGQIVEPDPDTPVN